VARCRRAARRLTVSCGAARPPDGSRLPRRL
jgi:hypothetical protein